MHVQELKCKYVVLTLYWISLRVFLIQLSGTCNQYTLFSMHAKYPGVYCIRCFTCCGNVARYVVSTFMNDWVLKQWNWNSVIPSCIVMKDICIIWHIEFSIHGKKNCPMGPLKIVKKIYSKQNILVWVSVSVCANKNTRRRRIRMVNRKLSTPDTEDDEVLYHVLQSSENGAYLK
jgi:hypothetical protein